jgi:hypothetical protein
VTPAMIRFLRPFERWYQPRCLLNIQSLPAAELQGVGTDDASNEPTADPTGVASQRLQFRVCRLSRMVPQANEAANRCRGS